MKALLVVESDPAGDPSLGLASCLSDRQTRSMKTLSIQRPRPSIETRMPTSFNVFVKAKLVNWLPWSVLKMPGLP